MCGYGLDSSDSGYDPVVGSCKHNNKTLSFSSCKLFFLKSHTSNMSEDCD
jgi:hypothetical protein